jgi:hypothetical protein
LLSWRHTGFNVHSRVRVKTKAEAERVGESMIRPLLALERLSFLGSEGKVGYRSGQDSTSQETMEKGITARGGLLCHQAHKENSYPLTDGGIKYWLRRLVAERAQTAKEAVRSEGQLIRKFGYASPGRIYIIADANGGWMFAAVSG